MARLIDADEAYKVLTDYYHQRTEFQHKALKEAIGRVPTADAIPHDFHDKCMKVEIQKRMGMVEVVRCKDCKFYTEDEKWCRRLGLCGAFNENGFCSFGERREDETD